MTGRRFFVVAALAAATLVVAAPPAAADPAGPTHYDSVITGLDDPDGVATGVDLEVLGGDAFLVVHVAPGTSVEVPGYDGEPYLRIDPDGTVHVNERSESRYANDDRYADAAIPPIADNEAPPSWVVEAEGGTYAWHDHRIHYMSPSLPRGVDADADEPQHVWDWSVPLLVDGRDVEVTGELTWLPGPSPATSFGLIAVFGLAAIGMVWRWPATLVPALAVMIAVTAVIGIAKMSGLPAGADGEPALLVLPSIAAGVLAIGAVLAQQRRSGALLIPAAGVPLLVWGILQSGALTRPVVPGPISVEVVRVAVAATLAVAVAAIVVAGRDVAAMVLVDPDADPDPVQRGASGG